MCGFKVGCPPHCAENELITESYLGQKNAFPNTFYNCPLITSYQNVLMMWPIFHFIFYKGILGSDVFLTCLLDTSTIIITTLYQHLLCLEHLTSEVAN